MFKTFPWGKKTGHFAPTLPYDPSPSILQSQFFLKFPLDCRWPSGEDGLPFHAPAQSYPTLSNPMDCSLLGSSVHRISQAKILEWIAISSFKGSSPSGDRTLSSCITGGFFAQGALEKPWVSIISNISNYHQLFPSILFITCFLLSHLLPWFWGPAFCLVILLHPHLLSGLLPPHKPQGPHCSVLSTHACSDAEVRMSTSLEWTTDSGAPGRRWIRKRQPAPSSLWRHSGAQGMRFSESVPSGIAPKHPFSCSGCLFASSWFSLFRKCSLKCSSALQVSFFNSRPLHSALMKETGVCNYKQDSPPTGMFSENSRKHTSTDSNVFWIKLQVFFQSE